MTTSSSDPDLSANPALWATYVQGLIGGTGVQQTNVLTTGTDIVSDLGDKTDEALAQVYRFGNAMPAWRANWQDSGAQLLSMYRTWLEAIRPTNATPSPEQLQQLEKLQGQIDVAKDDFSAAFKSAYEDYQQNYFINGKPIPGSPTWDEYRSSGAVAEKLTTTAHELDGPTSEYDTLAEQVYGDGYSQLQEARQVAAAADPDSAESQTKSNPDLEKRYQMKIAGDTGKTTVPLFEVDKDTFAAYKAWLAAAKGNTSRSPQIEFSQASYSYDYSHWQFMANLPIPLDDFFWAGVGGGGSRTSVDITKTNWKATFSFQGGIFYMPVKAPWLREDLMRLYSNFNGWTAGSPFIGKPLWGPNGIFNVYVVGLLIGYAPYIKVDVDNWQSSDVKKTWETSVSFGIGPFTLGSLGGASGSSEDYKSTETDTGFESYDVSKQPKIVGVVVDTPNWDSSNPGS